jgi:hypothetical protein
LRLVSVRGAQVFDLRLLVFDFFGEVFRQEFMQNIKRPLFWVLLLILGFMALEMSKGQASIGSGCSILCTPS